MSRLLIVAVVAVLGSMVAGCSSSNDVPVCSFDNPATIAPSAWPKFRHDVQNTGTVTFSSPVLSAKVGQQRWVFPTAPDPKGAFAASPVLNGTTGDPASSTRVYIGSTDGHLYAVTISNDPKTDGTQDAAFNFFTPVSITSSAVVAQRFGLDAVFFGAGDGLLYAVDSAGSPQVTNWPSPITGFLSSSPSLSMFDGTVFTASLNGVIAGICPNGVARFFLSTTSVQSSPAIGAEGNVYLGADDHQLRALRSDGVLLWSFAASAAILNAPVVAIANGATAAIYVADRGGLIFKVDTTGRPVSGFTFSGPGGGPVGPMQSSPALAGNRLYVGSDDGNLYAVDATSGKVAWTFPTGGPIVSSPAVALGGAQPVIVIGSNDGNVYVVLDTDTLGVQMAIFPIGKPVRSSPALGLDGTIYVGADDGHLYAIYL